MMFRRFESMFESDRPGRVDGLFGLIVSDYLACYVATPTRERLGVAVGNKQESASRRALLFLPRVMHTPCLHATVLIRLAMRSPSFTLGLWRTVLIAKHSIDINAGMKIGPGLLFP